MPRKATTSKATRRSARLKKANASTPRDFQYFPALPAELRLQIINWALLEDDKNRPARVILFDHNTYRVSPLVQLSNHPSPMLLVNNEFRHEAFKMHVPLRVFDLGDVEGGQYGHPKDWKDEHGNVQYSLDIAKMIDVEAQRAEECNYSNLRSSCSKGQIYVRPATDIFLTGLIPRQISECPDFLDALKDKGLPLCEDAGTPIPDRKLSAVACHITERLPLKVCSKIRIMRHMLWDPEQECPNCGDYHGFHCDVCFLENRGKHILDTPMYDVGVYRNAEEFGIYIMGGDVTPESILDDFLDEDDAVKYLLEEFHEPRYDHRSERYIDISSYRRERATARLLAANQ